MNDIFLRACRGERTEYTPVWIMRQAGRYLPQYKEVRKGISFLELCKTPKLCVEVTKQPIEYLGVDAAILFSDILIILEAMGLPLEFKENHGPLFSCSVRDSESIARLSIPDPKKELGFVLETIGLLRKELEVPLIGFAGAPFTCATYAIEGGSSKTFWETKKLIYTNPTAYHSLMEKITTATIAYLKAQIEAGAQALQLFDSWAGVLAPNDFAEHALPYVQQIVAAVKDDNYKAGRDIPFIYFANNGATLLELSAKSGADVLGLDWRINIGEAIQRLEKVGNYAVQGNLDPYALLLPEEKLHQRIATILENAQKAKGHIFNLGHGINQFTPPEQAKLAVELVHRLSRKKV